MPVDLPELTPEEKAAIDAIDMTPILGTPSERLQFAMDKAMEYFRRARLAEKEAAMLRAELKKTELSNPLTLDDAIAIAKGCKDYGGGHWTDGKIDAYHHGIQTVVQALQGAKAKGLVDYQVAVLHQIGSTNADTH